MNNKKALTLVETLVALTMFAVLSAATASLMLSSIGLRDSNQKSLKSEQFIRRLLEKHKDYWSSVDNYQSIPTEYLEGISLNEEIPDEMTLAISYSCLSSDGLIIPSDGSTLACNIPNPPLRKVIITLTKGTKIVASQTAEIGRPLSGNTK